MLLVLADHAGVAWLRGGYVGVDVFFVLSGFLITGLLIKELERSGRISLTNFYARRARRLLPAGTLVLLVTVAASYLVLGDVRAKSVTVDAKWAALFGSNLRFIQQGTDYLNSELPPSPLQHYWSLAVEEQFYVVWPLLMIVIARIATRVPLRVRLAVALSAIVAASLAWSWVQTGSDGTVAYFSPLTRAHELAAGGMLAVAAPWLARLPRWSGVTASLAGIVLVVYSALSFDSTTLFPGLLVMIPVLGAVMCVAGDTIAPGGVAERVFAVGPLQAIGRYSYSLYLWHWPLLVIVPVWFGRTFSTAANVMVCGVAFVLAWLTYVVLEHPVRDSARLRTRPAIASVGLGAALVALALTTAWGFHAMTSVAKEGTIAQPPAPTAAGVMTAVARAVDNDEWGPQPQRIANPAYSKGCDVTRADTKVDICTHGDPNGAKTMVVLGDSHAAMWIPALDEIGKRLGWKVIQLTKPGCQAPDFPRYSSTFKREYTECKIFRDWAMEEIEAIRPDLLVITSMSRDVKWMKDGEPATDGLEEQWRQGLASVIDRLSPVSGRVVVIGDMAYPREQGIDCLNQHPGDATACGAEEDYAVQTDFQALEQETALAHNAEFIDVIPWFCADDFCPAVIGGLTVHRDRLHIGENYSVWLSVALSESLKLT